MKKLLIFVTVLLLTISVIFILKKENRNFNFSYYFWENNYNLEQDTNDKLYIKVLDIKYSNKLEIIETNFIKSAPKDFIPVVFITNKTLQNLDYKVISDQIINLVKKFNFNEIQIDCDWSDSTKNNYFLLLKEF